MIHLTLTGYYAGRPLCDCDKAAATERGEEFVHYAYAPTSVFTSPHLCPACKAEVDALESEEPC